VITSALPCPDRQSPGGERRGRLHAQKPRKAAPAKKACLLAARRLQPRSSSARPAKSASTTRTAAKKAAARSTRPRDDGREEAGHAGEDDESDLHRQDDQSGCWPHDEDSRAGGAPPAAKTVTKKTAPSSRRRPRPRTPTPSKRRGPLDKSWCEQRALLHEERGATPVSGVAASRGESWPPEMEPGDIQFDEESGEGATIECRRERISRSAPRTAPRGRDRPPLARSTSAPWPCEQCGQPIPRPRAEGAAVRRPLCSRARAVASRVDERGSSAAPDARRRQRPASFILIDQLHEVVGRAGAQ